MSQRDCPLDILRFFALTGIILVHSGPPAFWCQIRGFDVSLIVFLSGVVYGMSICRRGTQEQYGSYCLKRFKRLVLPTWFFLIIYYVILYAGLYIKGHSVIVDTHEMSQNFSLMTGWYVWIIRVFFIIALLSPFVYKVSTKLSKHALLSVYILVLVLFELLAIPRNDTVAYFVTMVIPYVLFFSFGSVINRFSRKELIRIGLFMLIVYLVYLSIYYVQEGHVVLTDIKKYPPKVYYTSYATSLVVILWLLKDRIVYFLKIIHIDYVISWIGSHTLWIYFWHIIAITFLAKYCSNWIAKFVVIYMFGIIVTICQTRLLSIILRNLKNDQIKKNLNIIFNG